MMSKFSTSLMLLGTVINAMSIDQKEIGNGNAPLLDTSTKRYSGGTALSAIKPAAQLSGFFTTIVYGDNDCKGSNVFGYGFLLGACVVDYEFSTSTRSEATDATMTIYSFNDTACKNVNQASPSHTTDYKEGVCILGEKQFLRATMDIPLPGQSVVERYSALFLIGDRPDCP